MPKSNKQVATVLADGTKLVNRGRVTMKQFIKSLPANVMEYLDDGTDDDVTMMWVSPCGTVQITVDVFKPSSHACAKTRRPSASR